jgi:hypothetical protein
MAHDSLWIVISTLLGGVGTLAIFSFLIKENRFYRFFEHLFIGLAAGVLPVVAVRDFLWQKILEPMLGFGVVAYPDGTVAQPYQPLYLLYLLPMAFGLLYYFIYSQRYAWLAKVVIGFSLGASGALAIRGFFGETIPQITGSFKSLVVFAAEGGGVAWDVTLSNWVFVATLLFVLNYFIFTVGKEGSLQGKVAHVGRPLLMVCFGAFFGSTVMARLALLVERVQFMANDWVPVLLRVCGVTG